jgi:hypothetical protein
MENNDNHSRSNYIEILENDHPAIKLVIILPLFFLAIFLTFLLIELIKAEEKRENIIRIISFSLIQFVCLPFLIIFIIVNLVLVSLSFLCFKKLNYLSSKKVFEYLKNCFAYFSKKVDTTIKIEKEFNCTSNASLTDNYKDVNNDSKSKDNPLQINKFSENLNLNINNNKNINNLNNLNKNNSYKNSKVNNILSNALDNNNDKDINNIQNKKNFVNLNSISNNFDSKIQNKNNKEKNSIGLNNLIKADVENMIINNNNNLANNDLINNNTNQANKANIFVSSKDPRPLPVNKKANKIKIMDFLNGVLVNKDNTPTYVNLLRYIKDKSTEKLKNKLANNVVIFNK